MTSTSFPMCNSRKRQKTAGEPPGRSRCPSITELPCWPSPGPASYHPTSPQGSCAGEDIVPLVDIPTASIGASTLIRGIRKRRGRDNCIATGTGIVVADLCPVLLREKTISGRKRKRLLKDSIIRLLFHQRLI